MKEGQFQDLIETIARIINEKLDIPLINEENEQLLLEFILSLVFQFLVKSKSVYPSTE